MRKNFSRKRQTIYNALCATREHPSAEMLYTTLKLENPDLSLATVYRNLREFCADGAALSLGVINGHERFDGDTSRHSHFVCKSCGAVHDVEEAFPLDYMRNLEEKYGHEFEECELIFSGTCKPCREARQQVS